jgi:hypothetical protein
MEVGQGSNWGCSAKEKKHTHTHMGALNIRICTAVDIQNVYSKFSHPFYTISFNELRFYLNPHPSRT